MHSSANLYGPTEAAVEITAERIEDVEASGCCCADWAAGWNLGGSGVGFASAPGRAGVPGELYLGGCNWPVGTPHART